MILSATAAALAFCSSAQQPAPDLLHCVPGLTADEGLHFEVGNAESLGQFADGQFDAYTIAFGIRNVTDRQAALAEAFRVLKPGGRCVPGGHLHALEARALLPAAYAGCVMMRCGTF